MKHLLLALDRLRVHVRLARLERRVAALEVRMEGGAR